MEPLPQLRNDGLPLKGGRIHFCLLPRCHHRGLAEHSYSLSQLRLQTALQGGDTACPTLQLRTLETRLFSQVPHSPSRGRVGWESSLAWPPPQRTRCYRDTWMPWFFLLEMPCPECLLRFGSLSPGHIISVGLTLTPERAPQSPVGTGQPEAGVASCAAMWTHIPRYCPPSARVPGIPLALREGKPFKDHFPRSSDPHRRGTHLTLAVSLSEAFSGVRWEKRGQNGSHPALRSGWPHARVSVLLPPSWNDW